MLTRITITPKIIILAVVMLIGTSCEIGGSAATINESITLVNLLSQEQKIVTEEVDVVVRNCVSAENKGHSCAAGTSSNFSVSFGSGQNLTIGLNMVAEGQISLGISEEAGIDLGFDRDSGQTLSFDPPPNGYVTTYRVEEKYIVTTGQALLSSSNGNDREGNYIYRASCELTIIDQETLPCEATTPREPGENQPPQPANLPERAVRIKEKGEITIGVRENDLPPIAFRQGNGYAGFEADIAKEIVGRFFGDSMTINWVPLSAAERFEAVRNGEVDFLIRSFTHTKLREEEVLFTSNYFQDGARILVRRNSGIDDISDLNDKKVSVVNNTVATEEFLKMVANTGIRVQQVSFDGYYDAFLALQDGSVDVYIQDFSALIAVSYNDPSYEIVGARLTSEPIAIGIPPDSPDFRDEIDNILRSIIADGTWEKFYKDNNYPLPIPWTIEEMLDEPPANR